MNSSFTSNFTLKRSLTEKNDPPLSKKKLATTITTTNTSGSKSTLCVPLAELKPNTDVPVLAIIAGTIRIKETKARQFMTLVYLIDSTRPNHQFAFKLNFFRKTRQEIPIAKMQEGTLLYINPLYIRTFQNDVQGVCAANDLISLSIISFPTNTTSPFLSFPTFFTPSSYSKPPTFSSSDVHYMRQLYDCWLQKSRPSSSSSFSSSSSSHVHSELNISNNPPPPPLPLPPISEHITPPRISIKKEEEPPKPPISSSFTSNLVVYTSISDIVPGTSVNLVVQILDVYPIHEAATRLTITDFTTHSFTPSTCVEVPRMHYIDDCVLDPFYYMDLICWDEHASVAQRLRPGQIVNVEHVFVKHSIQKLRLVLHGARARYPTKLELLTFSTSDPRWSVLMDKKAKFIAHEDLSVTYIWKGTQSMYRLKAQFINLPAPMQWFCYFCPSCQSKFPSPPTHHPKCPDILSFEVLCEFHCSLKTLDGELPVVCQGKGALEFLGQNELPKNYIQNPTLMHQLNQRIKPLLGLHRPKYCDVTIQRIENSLMKNNETSPQFCIVDTRLH